MENFQPETPENGSVFVQQCPKEAVPDATPLRGFNINGFGMLDLSHHLENDTVMSTSSSTSGGLVIDHDVEGEAAENGKMSSNGRSDVFSTPRPRRRSSLWGGDKAMVVSNTRDYSQYLGMQPSVKFKCYKCSESNFPTLRHLKEHQQACLTQKANGPNGRRTNGEYGREPKAVLTEDPNTKIRISRKVFLCSACGTYYENWNLFLHMREVHRKHICLLCLGMFPSAERLHHHLEGRHNIPSADVNTSDTLQSQINSQLFYLMCVTCEHIFTEHDQFVSHNCDTYRQPCALCNVRGAHKANCRASVEPKAKRNGQVPAEAPKPEPPKPEAQAPEPPDPIGEMWKRYLNGDVASEEKPEPPSEVTSTVEECEPRLLVPKLKVKIPKEYQTKINSPVSSSTEAESDEEVNKSSEMSEEIPLQDQQGTPEVETPAVPPEMVESVKEEEEVVQPPPVEEQTAEEPEVETVEPAPPPEMQDTPEEVKPEPKVEEEEEEEDEDGIQIARRDAQMFDLRLNQPLDRINVVDLIRSCLKQTIPVCLYCNHTTRIVVNGRYLALHLIGTHRFTATVDSITAEELLPETIVARVKRSLDELEGIYINLETFDNRNGETALKTPCDRSFNCFQCRLTTRIHKELYQHNRKMHMKTVILCLMCKSALYSYSELLYHMCPGYTSTAAELRFRCGFCSLHNIPSAFRLMVHLRKKHGICEICLEDCGDQFKLSNHVWKHKLQHLCFRCGIVYRNKPDITKHLFWKHGTESVTCKKCLQKKWPLVYHFCTPPAQFTCEHCPQIFTRAVSLTVHRRVHTGDLKYGCEEENCGKKFISRKLLEKHTLKHSQFIADEPVFIGEEKNPPAETEKATVAMETEENVSRVTEKSEKSEKKVKKSKKRDGDAKKVDLMDIDLPAPNLSESDSDMDIDREDSSDGGANKRQPVEVVQEAPTAPIEEIVEEVKPQAVVPMEVEDEEEKATPVEDIWENFKTYQTLQQQASKVEDEEEVEEPTEEVYVPILHVSQSDHDYCSIYRVAGKGKPPGEEVKKEVEEKKHPEKSQSGEADGKSGESSDSSSDSGSSCTCESNCSCSSSSSSGSSSSSTSSSDEEDQGKVERKRKHMKKREKSSKMVKEEGKGNPDVIDVVTVDKGQEGDENYEVFYESDLVTEESDTDEDFYDEHPQKIAREMMMAWNRKFDGESRDEGAMAGDEAEEEAVVKREKSQKVKRKKKDKRHQKLPPLKLSLQSVQSPKLQVNSPVAPILTAALTASTPLVSVVHTPGISSSVTTPGDESSSGVKRSKRRRIPNKFYGYSSDEETTGGSNSNTPHPPAVLKPIQPPNLVWCKEDLPQSSGNVKTRSPSFQSLLMAKKSSPSSDFSTYNVQPSAQLPPQIFASTSPAARESTSTATVVQPLRLPLIPPVVPVNRTYSDMAEVQASGEVLGSPSGEEEEEEDEDSASSDASHLEIRDAASRMPPIPHPTTFDPRRPPDEKPSANVYCYCRCPYDEVSEMIACDGDNCTIEWFHFECVGIMVPPVGKWYCPQCKLKQQDNATGYF